MTEQQTPKAILFLDFDGTISSSDAVDVILETYADPKWLVFEEEWRAGRIGSRDCLRAQMALVRATHDELNTLLDAIPIDAGLSSLLEMCAAHDVPVHIISDGFDYCIRRILSRAGGNLQSLLQGVRVAASRLESKRHVWRTAFPFFQQTCGHGCATCKPAVMRLLNRTNAPALFVGDGLSDRYAAESANLVFAKNGLARYCQEQSIEHISYNNLEDVAAYLERWLASRAFLDDEIEERASA
jgi:2-hydroxy-3-keto-5-methylthiopentenyl-1-phosphate phosphatase